MLGAFTEISEVNSVLFSECSLGTQLEGFSFDSIDGLDESLCDCNDATGESFDDDKNQNLDEDEGLKSEDSNDAETFDDETDDTPEQSETDDASNEDIENSDDTSDSVEDKSEKDSEDKKINDTQEVSKKGGSYNEVKVEGEGDKYEVHHMPADSASPLERGDGPAIKMEKEDHRQTASCGMSKEAREYREKQKELIEQGKFREALQMDIDDIREKFGDKYDDAINEMLEYVDKLEKEGKI